MATNNPRMATMVPRMMSLRAMLLISRNPKAKGEMMSQIPNTIWNIIQYRKLPMAIHLLLIPGSVILSNPFIWPKAYPGKASYALPPYQFFLGEEHLLSPGSIFLIDRNRLVFPSCLWPRFLKGGDGNLHFQTPL